MALFFGVLLLALIGLVFLLMLQRRVQNQRTRAAFRQAETRFKGPAALLESLPSLLRNRFGTLVVVSGLAIGAMIVAALQQDDDDV